MKKMRLLWFALIWLLGLSPLVASAHVKWFTTWSFADAPTTLAEIVTPVSVGLLLLTMVALGLAVFIDLKLQKQAWYQRISAWFEARKGAAPLALRIGLGMTLLLAWQADTLLVPYLGLSNEWVGWLQFGLALLLIFERTTPIAGVGILGLYGLGIVQFGGFYMLDYLLFVGVAIYLMVYANRNPRIRALRIPALYFTVGFSLFWVAIEKLIYPQWGLAILADRPLLTLGLDPRFFLTSAAFVELALGYLFIIGLLERPMALLVTLVFFTTTAVFGRVEVVGHTIIHATLIVFLLEGSKASPYSAPIMIETKTWRRVAFASVNFVLLLALLVVPYALLAQEAYRTSAGVVFTPLLQLLLGA